MYRFIAVLFIATGCASTSPARTASPSVEPGQAEAQPLANADLVAESPPADAGAAPNTAEPEPEPDLSFLAEPPSPLNADGTCAGIIGVDGKCCSTVRVGGCTAADIEADRVRKEAAERAWRESLTSGKQDHGKYPSRYAALVRKWFTGTLKDPYSAKYGRISKPRKEHAIEAGEGIFGWSVCATVNAKNSFGAYTGNAVFWFLIVNNEIVRSKELEGDDEIYIGRPVNCADGP